METIELGKKYDVALSFAGEDRDYVEAVAIALRNNGLRVFYDKFEEADLIGRNLVDHLSDVYQRRARLCILFVSKAYASKPFPRLERQSAQATALLRDEPYIIPVRLDNADVPGLLSTIAYVSGKTPQALAQLITAKLIMSEPKGQVFSTISGLRDGVLVRFISLIEPDMETCHNTLNTFRHWAEENLGTIPIELRIPPPIQKQIESARSFEHTDLWKSPQIGVDARRQYSEFYNNRLPLFISKTADGVQTLVRYYGFDRSDRLLLAIRRFLMTRMTILCRLLLSYRLIGMRSPEWEPMFAHFANVWSDWVMHGLPYACFLDNDERFLWIDIDGRDTSNSIIWPHAGFRLYAPSEFLISNDRHEALTAEQFDRFFATQLLDAELQDIQGQPLLYFSQYPDRLKLTIRGEWAIDTVHFDQHGTSNFGGKPLYETVRKLRDHVLAGVGHKPLTDFERFIALRRIARLFRNSDQFEALL